MAGIIIIVHTLDNDVQIQYHQRLTIIDIFDKPPAFADLCNVALFIKPNEKDNIEDLRFGLLGGLWNNTVMNLFYHTQLA